MVTPFRFDSGILAHSQWLKVFRNEFRKTNFDSIQQFTINWKNKFRNHWITRTWIQNQSIGYTESCCMECRLSMRHNVRIITRRHARMIARRGGIAISSHVCRWYIARHALWCSRLECATWTQCDDSERIASAPMTAVSIASRIEKEKELHCRSPDCAGE